MEPTHEQIALAAYYLWEKHGWNLKRAGYTVEQMRDWCWFTAEAELAGANAASQSS